jgi:ribonucleoside-diphosphate reductase alpha chain
MSSDFSHFAETTYLAKYSWDQQEGWPEITRRTAKHVMGAAGYDLRHSLTRSIFEVMSLRKFMAGGRYYYAAGRPYHQTQNCCLMRAHDSREGWSELMHNGCMALMTGAGVGVDYSDVRAEGAKIRRTGGVATGPLALMQMFNEAGRGIMQGGSRRAAIWSGLRWNHPDVHKYVRIKNWSPEVRTCKEKDFSFPAKLDHTNISVLLDDDFFAAYDDDKHTHHALAHSVYWAVIEQMLKTGEPGFSIDVGPNAGETHRNACGEVTSKDPDDICNLGSVNMGRIETLDDFAQTVELGTKFLLAGTLYSDVPYAAIDKVRTKNRRLGLGLMGIHEWLLRRGKPYAPDHELHEWLSVYQEVSRTTATETAKEWEISRPKKCRAIAPTGTISIVAETTSGIEPVFSVAHKRRYLKGASTWVYQYVIDPVAKRLISEGVDPDRIEDAYTLAGDVERRVEFQAWVQQYVDHAISSTVNLPHWGSPENNEDNMQAFGNMLIRYLPKLRGVTVYPDGARGGQPLTPVPYKEALQHEGAELVEESVDVCNLTGKGTCG